MKNLIRVACRLARRVLTRRAAELAPATVLIDKQGRVWLRMQVPGYVPDAKREPHSRPGWFDEPIAREDAGAFGERLGGMIIAAHDARSVAEETIRRQFPNAPANVEDWDTWPIRPAGDQ